MRLGGEQYPEMTTSISLLGDETTAEVDTDSPSKDSLQGWRWTEVDGRISRPIRSSTC